MYRLIRLFKYDKTSIFHSRTSKRNCFATCFGFATTIGYIWYLEFNLRIQEVNEGKRLTIGKY